MAAPLRVLVAEDSENDARLLLHELKLGGFEPQCTRVDSAAALSAELDRESWDVVISDYHMPAFSGTAALALVRERRLDIPFIFVSGTIGEDVAVEAMRAGAQDYVMKGNLRRLVPAIRRELEEARGRRERQRAEAALELAQGRLRQVLASSIAVVYSMRLEGGAFIPVWVSENIERLLGYSVEEALSPSWWLERVHPGDIASVLAELTRLPERRGLSLEYRFQHNDGSYRWVHDQSQLSEEGSGGPLELVGAWLDVTERRGLEERYRQAQKMEAVGRLAGGIAHDFNNLLTIITAHTAFMKEDLGAGHPLCEDVSAIAQAATEAAGLTRQLLAFSRQQVLEPKVLDLNAAVWESERMLGRLIGEDVELVTVLDPALGQVRVDPGQVSQVIMNLAVNARDAMPEGGRLTIETANVDMNAEYVEGHPAAVAGRYVMLSVNDTGHGMDDETRARIFEPFFTTKEGGKGTGLGLATVYGIVKQSGGFIWVYSEPHHGTCFKIYLPRVDGPVEWRGHTASLEAAPRGTETILLVEDAAQVRAVSLKVLERQGYRVIEAPDGEAAIRLAQAEPGPIHLMLTDVVMPVLGGRRLAAELTRRRPEMRVLYVSGYTDDAVVRHGVLEAGVAYLQKPFTPDTLARKVREVLDAPRPG